MDMHDVTGVKTHVIELVNSCDGVVVNLSGQFNL